LIWLCCPCLESFSRGASVNSLSVLNCYVYFIDFGPFSSAHKVFTTLSRYLQVSSLPMSISTGLPLLNRGHSIITCSAVSSIPSQTAHSADCIFPIFHLKYLKHPCPVRAWPVKEFTSIPSFVRTVGTNFLVHSLLLFSYSCCHFFSSAFSISLAYSFIAELLVVSPEFHLSSYPGPATLSVELL